MWSINVAAKALIVVEASVVLEGGPSKRQHLQEVGREDSELGAKDNQRCVVGGHRGSGISAANVPLFAASGSRKCVLIKSGLGGRQLPGWR